MAYGHVVEGEPFFVYARREGGGLEAVVLKFECKDGMGILGIRKVGRSDPAPSTVYEENDIDPASLRAGRFVHVLGSGQRQSYALSRITPEIAARLPENRWVELKPHTEYGFRYLVAPEEQLEASGGPAAVAVAPAAVAAAPAAQAQGPAAAAVVAAVATRRSNPPAADPAAVPPSSAPLPPPQTPMAPPIAEAALKGLSKEQAVDALRAEMSKVHLLHARILELEEALKRSRSREKDLLDVLGRWQQ